MSKLHQAIAIRKAMKPALYSEITQQHKAWQKPEPFNGLVRTYRPKADDGERLPDERKRVQFSIPLVLDFLKTKQTELLDIEAQVDWANCNAKADVVVDGQVLIAGAPATYLLFLEKQLTDLKTILAGLPTLDESEDWVWDANAALWRTSPRETMRTAKVPKVVVLYPATEQHPAQTQMVAEDVVVGTWEQVKLSGALPVPEKQQLLDRVARLQVAVKAARAEANAAEAKPVRVGAPVLEWLLG